jgi:hypothetical protein
MAYGVMFCYSYAMYNDHIRVISISSISNIFLFCVFGTFETLSLGLGCSSVVEPVFSRCEALGLILSTARKRKRGREEGRN